MIRLWLLLFFQLSCFIVIFAKSNTVDSLLLVLEDRLASKDIYIKLKESKIDSLRQVLYSNISDDERFDVIGHLVDEYNSFNSDSAYYYSNQREKLARKIGNPIYILNAQMNRANTLNNVGMYNESLDIMRNISSSSIPDYLKPYYYHINRSLYGQLADYAAFKGVRNEYLKKMDAYRDSIIMVNAPGSLGYVLSQADKMNANNKPEESIRLLKEFKKLNNLNPHEEAIIACTLSAAYDMLGDKEKQKEYLLISAIYDMESAVREYISLRELALILYKEGDIDRAHRYMNICLEDATACNARLRIVELNSSYPLINSIYIENEKGQKRKMILAIVCISFLLLLLLVAFVFLRNEKRKVERMRQEADKVNNKLSKLNDELQTYNNRLSDANNKITEHSQLKEAYISQYMDQCIELIEQLDSYRKKLHKLYTTGHTKELEELLKSDKQINEELKTFYLNFDRTFLSLFPTFVEEFNELIVDGDAVLPKKSGTLSPELRIFALIRLGITDSTKIAKFLRYSLSTIYNYRTKIRNKARGERSEFEENVKKIGKSNV